MITIPTKIDNEQLSNLKDQAKKAIKQVYEGKDEGDFADSTLTYKWLADTIADQTFQGYGKDLSETTFDDKDLGNLIELRYNAYILSIFKNHSFIGDLIDNLTDKDGNVISWHEFKKLGEEIAENYYTHWLEAEFETAQATGQMSAKWQQFQDQKEQFPYLQYQTVGDDRVRAEHRPFDGVTYRVDHVFWDLYFPPNGWLCLCDVIQVTGPGPEAETIPKIPEPFLHNPGSWKRIITEQHPYFKRLSNEQKDTLKNQLATTEYMPYEIERGWAASIDPTFWRIVRDEIPVRISDRGGKGSSYYDMRNNIVDLNKGGVGYQLSPHWREQIIYHEFGHAAHFRRGLIRPGHDIKLNVLDAVDKCRKAIKGKEAEIEQRLKTLRRKLNAIHEKLREDGGQKAANDWRFDGKTIYAYYNEMGAAADTLMTLTQANFGWGHSKDYFNQSYEFAYMEWFAHASENRYQGNSVLKEVMPEVYDIMVDFILEIE